jgi:hypothetical protein
LRRKYVDPSNVVEKSTNPLYAVSTSVAAATVSRLARGRPVVAST